MKPLLKSSGKALQRAKLLMLALGLAAFVVAVPRITTGYSMMVMNMAIINYIAALGLSIMLGMCGMLSFATVSFMGLGAYTVANLTTGRLDGLVIHTMHALIIAIVGAGAIAFVSGLILLRLKGTYFTFASLGLAQVTWAVYLNYKPLCGGPDGISGIPTLDFMWVFTPANYQEWFYLLMGIAVCVGLFVERIRTTNLGRSLASIRDNEIAAQTLGVNVYMTRVWAFMLAGMLAALAGSLYVMHIKFVSGDLFTFDMSTTYVIMVMLGGVNSTPGAFVGAILVMMMPEWLRPLRRYLKLMWGVGVILLMMFMPMGLAGMVNHFLKKHFRIGRKNAAAPAGAGKEDGQ
ncbi:MAG: branched-chain amino acid ABC transporter permease [Planctomycetes bacterium]|nr:branched-chain amino acid ABC transporter permease [Planctomycetota bacterium]